VMRIARLPGWYVGGFAVRSVQGHEHDHATGGQPFGPGFQVAGDDLHGHVHAGGAGAHERGLNADHVTDEDGAHELDAAHGHSDAIGACPADGGGVTGLVDPFHDHAAVYLAAKVDVTRLRQKTERDAALPCVCRFAFHGAPRSDVEQKMQY